MKALILLFSVLFATMSFAQVPSYVPANGLLGWWPFNGNANDESGNGNNGIVSGATLTTDLNGDANSAYIFDGINDYINAGDFYNFNNSNFTISVWLVQIGPTSNALVSKREVNGYGNWWHLTLNNFMISASNNGPSLLLAPLHENFNKYTWTNYTITREGNVISFFANGILSSQDILSTTYNMNNNANLIFGSLFYDGAYGDFHNGKLDDIGIWNRALTDCEIQNLYTSTNPTNTITTATACNSYTWNGTTYSTSGVYAGTTTNCVTEYLNLTITPSSTNTTTATACDSYTWNGTNYSESGVYTGTTANCVTESLNLTITPSSTNTTSETACDSYLWNGTNYSESGVYTGTTTNCVTESLDLTITPSSTNTTTATACDSYTWNGTNYSESGVYTGTTANCITESLNLTITPSSTNTTPISACNSYAWNGQTYTQSGVYTGTTANCVTESLDLTITPSFTNTTTASACDSYVWNGTSYSTSGVYSGTTTNCVTESLDLTITQTFSDTTIAIACDSYTWNGQTYTESGTYTGITENCITQSLKLTINPSTSSSISQTALDSYTWPVNNQTYTTTGAYTVVIPNASGCDSTITLNLTMSFTGINDLSYSKLSVYPNPTNADFTITGLELVGTVSSLSLTDMNGKVVKVLDPKATKFSMASIKPGVYFLNIISGNKQEVLKIVKE
jgi:hypothetical protein